MIVSKFHTCTYNFCTLLSTQYLYYIGLKIYKKSIYYFTPFFKEIYQNQLFCLFKQVYLISVYGDKKHMTYTF